MQQNDRSFAAGYLGVTPPPARAGPAGSTGCAQCRLLSDFRSMYVRRQPLSAAVAMMLLHHNGGVERARRTMRRRFSSIGAQREVEA